MHTLAHESFHLRGIQSEAITECYALQNTAFVAERLGIDGATAQRLQKWVFPVSMVFSSDARFIQAIINTRPVDCSWMIVGINPSALNFN